MHVEKRREVGFIYVSRPVRFECLVVCDWDGVEFRQRVVGGVERLMIQAK